MKILAALALLTATAAADAQQKKAPPPDVSGPATLVPGTSIGPFTLGMSRRAIENLGVAFKTPATSIIVTGPYEIGLDKTDVVTSIARRMAFDSDGKALTGALLLAGKSIAPKISFADLQKRIPGCKAPEALIGGTVAKCADHTSVIAAGPVGIVEVKIER